MTLEPRSKVTFFQATGPREGAIVNELFEDEAGALQLKFYCYLGLRGKDQALPPSAVLASVLCEQGRQALASMAAGDRRSGSRSVLQSQTHRDQNRM